MTEQKWNLDEMNDCEKFAVLHIKNIEYDNDQEDAKDMPTKDYYIVTWNTFEEKSLVQGVLGVDVKNIESEWLDEDSVPENSFVFFDGEMNILEKGYWF
jgi:hypothetical protein